MTEMDGISRAINVKVCHRIGGERSILVCERCYNEVEGEVTEFYYAGGEEPVCDSIIPRYNFCPWCSAPLREE